MGATRNRDRCHRADEPDDLRIQLDAKQKDIDRVTDDSKRLRDNIQRLKDSSEERALARRYAGEMNADEDQLQKLRKEHSDLEQRRGDPQ